ncbi:unnamed protein product, partial [Mesorhabditis spiculigera]
MPVDFGGRDRRRAAATSSPTGLAMPACLLDGHQRGLHPEPHADEEKSETRKSEAPPDDAPDALRGRINDPR